MKPRVYYKGLPKKFIAGTVFDPKADEVIIGGTVHAHRSGQNMHRDHRPFRRFLV